MLWILMSIKSHFAELIMSGVKTLELRKIKPRSGFNRMFVYASSPQKSIIGYFTVEYIICKPKQDFDEVLLEKACVDQYYFNVYFDKKEYAYGFL